MTALGFVGFLMLTEFSPPTHVFPPAGGSGRVMNPSAREFTFVTWNIGYAGLGRKMDFFYDGGKSVRPEQEECERCFAGIKNQVMAAGSGDFIFLQEVDERAKRSWYTNEVEDLAALLPDFSMTYAENYRCRFVPVPLQEPMGSVSGGLATFSTFRPFKVEVQYFDAFFPWPKRLVFLKRCFILQRFGLDNGRELVVINTHNSAFDYSGVLRKRELAVLDSAMRSEYQRGNYVVAGGDWNINPRGFHPSSVITGDRATTVDPPAEPDVLSGWQFAFDPSRPSNRNVDMPYVKGVTGTTIIDFFVVSPNIEVSSVAAIPMGFAYSDHEPVVMRIRLK